MRKTSEETKIKEHRGTGEGSNYKPWIEVGEFGSIGTCSKIKDWKHGRIIHCLSQIEADTYYTFRFDDDVLDIREQFPLDKSETLEIAEKLGVNHPATKTKIPITMTTDFLLSIKTPTGVRYRAINIKSSESIKENKRFIEKANIEKIYWERRGVEFQIVTRKDISNCKANNIRFCSMQYNLKKYPGIDDITIVKHMIIRKMIPVDLDENISYLELSKKYKKEIEEWRTLN